MKKTCGMPPCPVGTIEKSPPFQRRVRVAVCCLLLLHLASPANARILRVAQDGDGTDGATWETAFQSVGGAILSATAGDEIWVKEGAYIENLVLHPELSLLGGFSGNELGDQFNLRNWRERETIISGPSLYNLSPDPIVTAADGCVMDGFTLRYGTGGVYCEDASMEIRHCYIHRNQNGEGAGVFCISGGMIIEDCVFERNQGWDGVGAYFIISFVVVHH